MIPALNSYPANPPGKQKDFKSSDTFSLQNQPIILETISRGFKDKNDAFFKKDANFSSNYLF
ncbi:hypothetical protein AQ505_04550 [Pedobacter sp. PACM 27299]|nr:hypothetical protein AQ505_04550 [Pedobacter sp. PACM 27299]